MPVYRQKKGSETWHFHPECSKQPKDTDAKERKTKPTTGKLCAECQSKAKKGAKKK